MNWTPELLVKGMLEVQAAMIDRGLPEKRCCNFEYPTTPEGWRSFTGAQVGGRMHTLTCPVVSEQNPIYIITRWVQD